MLHAARYVRAAGGLDRLLDVKNGAQRTCRGHSESPRRLPNSAHARPAQRRGASHRPARAGERSRPTGSGRGRVRHRRRPRPRGHRVQSPLPPGYQQLAHRGRRAGPLLAYSTPGGPANYSGQALSDEAPPSMSVRTPTARHDLMGFVDARGFDSLPIEERRRDACAALRRCSATKRSTPLIMLIVGVQRNSRRVVRPQHSPGSWTKYGHWLRGRSVRSLGEH